MALDESRDSEIWLSLELADWLALILKSDDLVKEVGLESIDIGSEVSLKATGWN